MKGDEVTVHSTKLYALAQDLLDNRKANPRDVEEDPASSLLAERVDGQPLQESHLIGCLRQALVVGMVVRGAELRAGPDNADNRMYVQAPPILLGSICNHLSKDKSLQEELRENPSLIPAAVEEFIRLYSPYRGFARTVAQETTLHGRMISPGVPITMTYAAANRDPEVFENPNEFILNRRNITAHLGFGRGRHRCIGMPLARTAIQIALSGRSAIVNLSECVESNALPASLAGKHLVLRGRWLAVLR